MSKLDKIIRKIYATLKEADAEYLNSKFILEELNNITDETIPSDECAVELRRLLQQMYIAYLYLFRVVDTHVPKKSVVHSPEHARIFLIAESVHKLKVEFSSFVINQIDDDFEFPNSHEYFYQQHLILKFFYTRSLAHDIKNIFTENDYGELVDFNHEKFKIFIRQPFNALTQLKQLITLLDQELLGLKVNYPLEVDNSKAAVLLYQDVLHFNNVHSFMKPQRAIEMNLSRHMGDSPDATSGLGITVQHFLIAEIFNYQCFKAETEDFLLKYGMRAPDLPKEISDKLKVHKKFVTLNIDEFNAEDLEHDSKQAEIIQEYADIERMGSLTRKIGESIDRNLEHFRSINIGRILRTLSDIRLSVYTLYYIDECLAKQKACYKDTAIMASIATAEKITDRIEKMQRSKSKANKVIRTPASSPSASRKTKDEKSEVVSASDNSPTFSITPASSPAPEELPEIKDEPAQEPQTEDKTSEGEDNSESKDNLEEKAALLAICDKQYQLFKTKKSEYDHEERKLSKLISACNNRKKKSNLKSTAAEKSKKLEQRFKDLSAKLDAFKIGDPSCTLVKLEAFKHEINSVLNNIETYFIKPIMELQSAAAKSSTSNESQQDNRIKKEKLQNELMRAIVKAAKDRFSRLRSTLPSPQPSPTSISVSDLQRTVSDSSQALSQDGSTESVSGSWEDLAGPTPETSPNLKADKKTDTMEIGVVSLSSGSEEPAAHINKTFSLTVNVEPDSENSDACTSPISIQPKQTIFPNIQSPLVTSPEPSAAEEEEAIAESLIVLSTLSNISHTQYTNSLVASLETGTAVPETKPDLNEYSSDPEDFIAVMIERHEAERAEEMRRHQAEIAEKIKRQEAYVTELIRRQEMDRVFAPSQIHHPVLQESAPRRVVSNSSTLSLEAKIIRPPEGFHRLQQFFQAQPTSDQPLPLRNARHTQSDLNVRAKAFRPKR